MARADLQNLGWWLGMAAQSFYRASLLAEALHISRRQLQRDIQELFGRSPQAWLDIERLLIAPGLLQTHRSVKMVAFALGFRQVSHFSRVFKLFYGFTAADFLHWGDSP